MDLVNCFLMSLKYAFFVEYVFCTFVQSLVALLRPVKLGHNIALIPEFNMGQIRTLRDLLHWSKVLYYGRTHGGRQWFR